MIPPVNACTHPADASLREAMRIPAVAARANRLCLRQSRRVDIPSDLAAVIVVETGRLSVETLTPDGREAFLTDVEPGELIGEAFVFDDCALPTSVVAEDRSDVWCFQKDPFARVFGDTPDFAAAVMRALARRQCRLLQRLTETATQPVEARLRAELLRLADARLTIERMPTHRRIALRIGTHREAVTKELGRMERAGLISRDGRALRLEGVDWLKARG